MGIWRGFKRFWHDQITTPNGDVDGARVGLLIILIGAGFYIYFEWYALTIKAQAWDPSAYGDGLIKIGAALLTAAGAVTAKASTEAPYNPAVAAANFPNDPGAQAAVGAEISNLSAQANNEVQQVSGVWNNVTAFYHHVKAFFNKPKPPQPPQE